MEAFELSHPQAVEAVRLAHAAPYLSRAVVTHRLQSLGIPRALFVLACILRAATVQGV